ncbi:Alpha/Beta hydrolase protein [Colletotrichum phormii]|uniref:Alpha/Beta hydrolase protein n=1 Tax=Colletotrichum phormii TaxID=359342 RepID=A0AAI9ZSK1_9PEZI|nr:Alpha/Beta hydrolase protein [Colletotrichum phormii]KAK1637086.1 Alpha/Beta hydrolase protein [Colletotrichum phormii]
MASLPFSARPYEVPASAKLTPTSISIPDAEIDSLKTLLKLTPIPKPNRFNSRGDESFGLHRDVLSALVKYWENDYDWRKWESTLNTIPQFNMDVTDDDSKTYKINFFALFSKNPSAIPILFLHSWPGSVVEYPPILRNLQSQYDSESLPYHVIVPHHMMHALGFDKSGYIAQGGDLGGWSAPVIANLDSACKLVQMSMLNVSPPAGEDVEAGIEAGRYTPDEVAAFARSAEFAKTGTAFIQLNGTKPASAGYIIGSNPVALLSWIGDKMIKWSDKTPDRDLIITNLALYWFTGCFPTSVYIHRVVFENVELMMNGWKTLKVPLGYSAFKYELVTAPERWIRQTAQVSWYRMHERGGHFAALEEPETLWKDVEDFIGKFWPKAI